MRSDAEIMNFAMHTPMRDMPFLPYDVLTDARFISQLSLAGFMTFGRHCDETPSGAITAMSQYLVEKAQRDPEIKKFIKESRDFEDPWRFDWEFGYRP
jgi:hypothetical protein